MSSMIKSHLSIFNSFGIYTLSNIVIAASTFAIIPFMTRYLDFESLGYIFLFQTMLSIFFIFISLGAQSIIQIEYHQSFNNIRSYISSSIINSFICCIILCIFIFFNTNLFKVFFNEEHSVVFIASLFCFLLYFQNLIQGLLQTMQAAKYYAFLAIGTAIISAVFSVLYLIYIDTHWHSRIWGILAGYVFSGIVCITFLANFNLKLPTIEGMKHMLLVGYPVIFHSLSMLMINQSDKILIGALLDQSAVGAFGVPAQLASAISVIGSGMAMAYAPKLYSALSSKNSKELKSLSRIRNMIMLALALIGIGIGITLFFFKSLILGNNFIFYYDVFFILITSYVLFGFYHLFSPYYYFYKKTKILSSITSLIAILNIVFTYFLIPIFGILGAALGTLMSYFLGLIIAIIYTNMIFKKI